MKVLYLERFPSVVNPGMAGEIVLAKLKRMGYCCAKTINMLRFAHSKAVSWFRPKRRDRMAHRVRFANWHERC